MDRAQQMYKDGVMSKSFVEDAEKAYQLALNKQISAQRNLTVSRAEIAKAEAQVRQAMREQAATTSRRRARPMGEDFPVRFMTLLSKMLASKIPMAWRMGGAAR